MKSQHGVGLRTKHYPEVLERGLSLGLVEAITENFLDRGGRPRAVIERVRRDSDVALHGVSLSLAGSAPLDLEFLARLKQLSAELDACWLSDHLCFGRVGKHYGHDLWPVAFTEETLAHVAARLREIQDRLGQRILVENVSSYVQYGSSTLSEWEFLAALVRESGCGLLLDVNNVFVSATNHSFSATEYIEAIPRGSVGQLHLAGHLSQAGYLLDNHGGEVCDAVWQLYRQVVQRFGAVPCIIEWDENVPELPRLLAESATAARIEAEELRGVEQQPAAQHGPDVRSTEPAAASALCAVDAVRISATVRPELGNSKPNQGLIEAAPSWAGLQQLFWRAVRYDPAPPEVDSEFLAHQALSGRQRMAIYRKMYWYRQVNALFDSFPKLARALGTERFTKLITRYISAHPSQHFALERLGRSLAAFIREDLIEQGALASRTSAGVAHRAAEVAARGPGLETWHADLAELEWLHLCAFLAKDGPVLDTSAIDPSAFARSTLRWNASLHLASLSQAALSAWDDCSEQAEAGRRAEPRAQSAESIEASAAQRESGARDELSPRVVAVWRRGFLTRHASLAADEAEALRRARAGESLAQVCEAFAEHGDPVARGFEVLRGWFSRTWISAIATDEPALVGHIS